uniref:ATP synthase complex subunit 8 n=1 Tax=Blasticotoma sp. 'tegularis' TaxID=2950360 RepID=A0A977XUM2_9HYME|nr:ATP synthase F0 subunit 8 [Blasticotoma sp. 'tegularis']
MPQMSPILWLPLFIFFNLIFFLFIIMFFFFFLPPIPNMSNLTSTTTPHAPWKW